MKKPGSTGFQPGHRKPGKGAKKSGFFRLNLQFNREWDGRNYAVQQIAAVVAEEKERLVVVTVNTFYFQEEENL